MEDTYIEIEVFGDMPRVNLYGNCIALDLVGIYVDRREVCADLPLEDFQTLAEREEYDADLAELAHYLVDTSDTNVAFTIPIEHLADDGIALVTRIIKEDLSLA